MTPVLKGAARIAPLRMLSVQSAWMAAERFSAWRQQRIQRRNTLAVLLLAIASAATVALLHVFIHLQLIRVGYDLARETKARHDLGEQNQKLRLELATRKDPAVIERRAREELHMAPPDPRLIRILRTPIGSTP